MVAPTCAPAAHYKYVAARRHNNYPLSTIHCQLKKPGAVPRLFYVILSELFSLGKSCTALTAELEGVLVIELSTTGAAYTEALERVKLSLHAVDSSLSVVDVCTEVGKVCLGVSIILLTDFQHNFLDTLLLVHNLLLQIACVVSCLGQLGNAHSSAGQLVKNTCHCNLSNRNNILSKLYSFFFYLSSITFQQAQSGF